MASHQINLNYCAQCREIDQQTVLNCRWLNVSFCRLSCLKAFYEKVVKECDLCKKSLDYNRIHLRDDIQSGNLFTFVCDQCFDRRAQLLIHCYCCSKVCYKGFDTHNVTTSGLISKYLCSVDCESKSTPDKRIAACSVCDADGKYAAIFYNNQKYSICSSSCLLGFEKSHKISIGLFPPQQKTNENPFQWNRILILISQFTRNL